MPAGGSATLNPPAQSTKPPLGLVDRPEAFVTKPDGFSLGRAAGQLKPSFVGLR